MGTPQPPQPGQHLLTYTWWDLSPKHGTSHGTCHGGAREWSPPLTELRPGGSPPGSKLAGAGGKISPHLDQTSGEEGGQDRCPQPGKEELGGG